MTFGRRERNTREDGRDNKHITRILISNPLTCRVEHITGNKVPSIGEFSTTNLSGGYGSLSLTHIK